MSRLAIEPVSRTVWVTEVALVALVFLALVFTYKHFRFSNADGLLAFLAYA